MPDKNIIEVIAQPGACNSNAPAESSGNRLRPVKPVYYSVYSLAAVTADNNILSFWQGAANGFAL